MDVRAILDDLQIFSFGAAYAEFRAGGETIGEQSLFEGGIGPGFGNDAGACFGAHFFFIMLHDLIDPVRVDDTQLMQ
jgi:hypothetical protein